ncbi:ATP-dependent zinc protease family protein [Sunxiuqinia sp. A32]|uniref:ATP-dependent zinc protease family protein n=1 Tax=Sunxiuqinia sp. A32 TaxID=3461496 RepID=UPI004045CBAF
MRAPRILIGREDKADFPKLELMDIEVKVDTGAFTSSFHCHKISMIEEDGVEKLCCNFLDPEHEKYHNRKITFDQFNLKKVRSSNGILEERFSIETTIQIFDQLFPIELTLTERGSMKFPVLLGRKFLSKKFIVDSSMKDLSRRGIVKLIKH